MKKIIYWILYIWQLPQHLIAVIIVALYKKRITKITELNPPEGYFRFLPPKVYEIHNIRWGVCFGQYIFVASGTISTTVYHEFGHSVQSKILGPLYLLIVGLPSATMNVLSTIFYFMGNKTFMANYYKRWPESWADKLGGVIRRG